MVTRRAVCVWVAVLLGGCANDVDPPRKHEAPSIVGDYLPERNAVRLWYAGRESPTSPEEVWVEVVPAERHTGGSQETPAIIESGSTIVDNGLWIASNGDGIAGYPLEPNDEVVVTGYERRMTPRELGPGDRLQLNVAYEEHNHHYSVLTVPEDPPSSERAG